MSVSVLLHGSDHIIKKPSPQIGNEHNDYGRGFYCTTQQDMAKEWACKQNTNGFVNRYSFDDGSLSTLNLLDGTHSILNWIALLLKFRTFSLPSEIAVDARKYIINNFSIELSVYDVAIGYRADDSHFSFAQGFVSNTIPLRSLNRALRLGKLGAQTVLISEKAFNGISFLDAETVDNSIYYQKFIARDITARESYRKELKPDKLYRDDIFVLDIMREEMKNGDSRIQRILPD